MVVQAKPLQTLIRLRVIDQDKQGIIQMLSFGVFPKGGDLHNPFNKKHVKNVFWEALFFKKLFFRAREARPEKKSVLFPH